MDLEALEDGGMIDEDTMPEWMRKKMEEFNKKNISEQSAFLMGSKSIVIIIIIIDLLIM